MLLTALGIVFSFWFSQWAPIVRMFVDCEGYPPLPTIMTTPNVTALFRGTVSEIKNVSDGQLVTFHVARVWKGDVARETVVYSQMAWTMGGSNGPPLLRQPSSVRPFEQGVDYLVATQGDMSRTLKDGTTLDGLGAQFGLRGTSPCFQTMPFAGLGVSIILGDAPGDPPK